MEGGRLRKGEVAVRITGGWAGIEAYLDRLADEVSDPVTGVPGLRVGDVVGPKGDPRKSVLAGDWCGTAVVNAPRSKYPKARKVRKYKRQPMPTRDQVLRHLALNVGDVTDENLAAGIVDPGLVNDPVIEAILMAEYTRRQAVRS